MSVPNEILEKAIAEEIQDSFLNPSIEKKKI